MITVMIVDDEALVRTGLRLILEPAGDIELIAEASDGRQAVDLVRTRSIDVVLMDIRMPGTNGIAALEELTALARPPQVIMLTTFDLDSHIRRALRAGAAGFLLKDASPDELINAIRTVATGDAILAPSVTRRLIADFADHDDAGESSARKRLEPLSPRERDVASAVSRGLSNAEIGRQLRMTETTVKAHVSRSLAKLNLSNRVQLALLAHQAGDPGKS
ncbi:response regulator transcription factor [Microlunatus soli]|uniref:DNA-binding response regulator, NarL/FixJ family, contains REC and HTH domains n=1 Tax=Microlunatus soli TaxID=630515 RepID=A0A1H1NQS1_9ACTN|nr:response regulator transcription factor [Microlunatus soli]SDS00679.1 DNA-binding response regulator, NarL/FixJ family, contains REC and HTH domains [Microlunatus soli]